ncbi:DUF2254 domain-containing protein [Marinobacter guineae]|uniref:DUF2254 domain-containing protein n=1 Tax=Marinobacter guineae TaxID=432303 RepID=UPI00117E762A|nr:DUF2254 domain-containing protein [Marinobacter guineae]
MINKALATKKRTKLKIRNTIKRAKKSLVLLQAKTFQRLYYIQNLVSRLKSIYGGKIAFLALISLLVISVFFTPLLQLYIEPYFSKTGRLDLLREFFLSLGGALIGATAIAFSLIMFAMQVNVERMPHGLFRKFSSDAKLLGSFIVTFSLAIVIAGLSFLPETSWVAGAIVTTVLCSFLIILLFVLAYRRALTLISPTMQLSLLVNDTKKSFRKWDRAAKRTTPIFQEKDKNQSELGDVRGEFDMYRLTYFQLHPNWTSSAEQAIYYCITFARRYAEQGDHEVSRVALNGVVAINSFYVKAKGRTFFSNNYFFENLLASDSFLLGTLEHFRQNIQIGISRKDEQFIEQNYQSLFQLTRIYLSIEYGDLVSSKSHAHLVAGYLEKAVEDTIPHNMADVLIQGVSVLGSTARLIVAHDRSVHIGSISEKIGFAGCTGVVNKNYQAVSQIAVKQLATLTFDLLRSRSADIDFAIKQVRNQIKLIAEMYLSTPDTPLMSTHSSSLAPYYSGTSENSLMAWLTELTNALSEADSNNKDANLVIGNISEWGSDLYQTEKELLLLSIEKKSHLTFDLVHWIVYITKLLLAISCSKACDHHHTDKLRKSAMWLIWVLSWVPGDEETIKFLETFRIADTIFESAVDAHKRDCATEALEVRKLLLNWTHKSGKYQTGWATLEKACCGLACLNIILGLADDLLLDEIDAYLTTQEAPSVDIRSRTARDLHQEAEEYREGYGHGAIDLAMSAVDQEILRILLHKIADHLSP